MRNLIDFLTQHMMQAGSYEIVAAAVCAALPFLALALFAALRVTDRPSYRFKARCKAFEKRSGAITFSNAPLFGKKVLKRAGDEVFCAWRAALPGGVSAAGRASAALLAQKSRIRSGFFLAALAGIMLTGAAFAFAGYGLSSLTAAAMSAALWLVSAAAYLIFGSIAGKVGEKKGQEAARLLLVLTAPASLPPAAIAEEARLVKKDELDKLVTQVEDMLEGGIAPQLACVILGGIEGMLDSALYCGAERLRLTNLRERVKKICA